MPGYDKIIKALSKLRRLRKLKFLKNLEKGGAKGGELAKIERGLTKVEGTAVKQKGLAKIKPSELLKPNNAGAVTGVLTSRTARLAEERALGAGSRKFPKWIKGAGAIEDAVIIEKKGSRFWNLAKKGGKFGLEVAAWGIAGYYFDRALDYLMGNEGDGNGGDASNVDKKGLSPEDAYHAAAALADEVHGLNEGWPIGMVKDFDLSRDSDFAGILSDLYEAIIRPGLSDTGFAQIRANSNYDSSRMALLFHRASEALKRLAELTPYENTLKLALVQSVLSDDYTIVSPLGYQVLDDEYQNDDAAELAAEGHFMNIANFVDEYRADASKKAFDDMTDVLEVTEDKNDFLDALSDPTKLNSKLAIYLLGSYSNDKFEDVMGMLRSFTVDGDGNDDETMMLNFISRAKQRSFKQIQIINKTL